MREHALLHRWIRFNGVGGLGIAVQLAVLAALVRHANVDYLLATAIAVEAAVLHNFFWHERWTWRDRQSRSVPTRLARLGRFHLLNGAISMIGNLAIMQVLTGRLGIDPLGANIAAVIVCSVLNFLASELLVFRRAAAAAVLLLILQPLDAAARETAPHAAEMLSIDLQAKTVEAWNAYEQRVDERYRGASQSANPFFALDQFKIAGWRSTAMAGNVAMARLDRPQPGGPRPDVPDGKIHHWAGAVFVPNTSVASVLDRLLKLAGQESKYYDEVIASKLLAREGDRVNVFLRLRRSKFGVTATYNTEHTVEYRRLGTARATARSVATRIAQVDDAGTAEERERKIGSDSGYLWRLNAYWRYEAVDGGVLIECESVSLSRDVPMVLKLFITRVAEGLARESLERTLIGLRTSLSSQRLRRDRPITVARTARRAPSEAPISSAETGEPTQTASLARYYLNRSSNALRALDGPDVLTFVSRSTVVRGSKNVQTFRASFGETRAGTGFWHSNGALVSKYVHWAQACRSAPQRVQVPSGLQAEATVSSLPHRTHRTTSRNPGMLKVFGRSGGCPLGAYSFFGACGPCRRGSRGSSWYPRCRYFRSLIARNPSPWSRF